MDITSAVHRQFCFKDCTLDVDRGTLLKGGTEIRLRRQSFDVLRYLVERRGRLVTRDELLSAIWGQAIVTDGSLTQCLIDIRRAIGDDAKKMIRTVPRRGYIFDTMVSQPVATGDVSDAAPREPDTMPPRVKPLASRRAWAAALVVLLVAGTSAWWMLQSDVPVDAAAEGFQNSIAVMPFNDLSKEQDQGYFSDGIAEEIMNLLAQFPDLHVIARTSSFAFKGTEVDIATIAEKLNVSYVLEGSVRRSGDRLRITTQLIDTATSAQLWSDAYNYETGNVFAVQTEIALAVAQALRVELSDLTAVSPGASENPEAYESYLQGRFFHNRRGPGDSERAAINFRHALDIDPKYGRAWSGLAGTYLIRISEEGADTKANWEGWRQAAEQALEYAPELAEVQIRAAQYYFYNGERERALEHVAKASALDPNHPLVLGGIAGNHAMNGRLDLAIEYLQRAVALDPLSAVSHGNLGTYLAAAGRFDEALAEYRDALDLSPTSDNARLGIGAIYILQNRFDEALQLVQQWPDGAERDQGLVMIYHGLGRTAEANTALESLMSRSGPDTDRLVAEVYAHRGEADASFKWLLQGRHRVPADSIPEIGYWLDGAHASPFLIELRDDPRWNEVTARSIK